MSQPASRDDRVYAIVQAVRDAAITGLTESQIQQRMPFVAPADLQEAIRSARDAKLIEQASGIYYFPLNNAPLIGDSALAPVPESVINRIAQAVRYAAPTGLTQSQLQRRVPFATLAALREATLATIEAGLIVHENNEFHIPLRTAIALHTDALRGNPALAALLHQDAELLRAAADKVSRLAERAASGNVGSTEQGFGYHYLADQALHAVITVLANMSTGRAFQAAADVDHRGVTR